jgi:hypothetical protein
MSQGWGMLGAAVLADISAVIGVIAFRADHVLVGHPKEQHDPGVGAILLLAGHHMLTLKEPASLSIPPVPRRPCDLQPEVGKG